MASHMDAKMNRSDVAVQATNDDATVSKLSCVKKGYVKDDFVQFFTRRAVKRAPVINRGYYARWAAIRLLLDQFLISSPEHPKQILSLGAGFDTTYFQLKVENRAPSLYVEVDFKEVTARKAAAIASHDELRNKLQGVVDIHTGAGVGSVGSADYHLLPVDLRDTVGLHERLAAAGVDFTIPTLVVGECVLIYMDAPSSRHLIRWAASAFSSAAFVIYEQILPHDPFGQQMVHNLESRGCPLLGIEDTPTLEAKERRFTDLGFERAEALDMDAIYNERLNLEEVRRIERLEIFDEFEEWHMMQEHYCIAIGIKDKKDCFHSFGFSHSQMLRKENDESLA